MAFLACCNGPPPPWNQSRGDISNTDQELPGPGTRPVTVRSSIFVGKTSQFTGPVVGSDGSVFVSTFAPVESDGGNALTKVSGDAAPAILARRAIVGQVSTPAVDASGNVYVSVFSRTAPAQIMGFGPGLASLWSFSVPGKAGSISPPKVLTWGNQTLIFVILGGGYPVGAHLMMFSTAGKLLSDTLFCASYHGGISLPGFTVSPVDLGPPDVPAHGVAIRKAVSDGNVYAVAAADACGLASLRLEPGPSSNDPSISTAITSTTTSRPSRRMGRS
jgi:hypothetical protein